LDLSAEDNRSILRTGEVILKAVTKLEFVIDAKTGEAQKGNLSI